MVYKWKKKSMQMYRIFIFIISFLFSTRILAINGLFFYSILLRGSLCGAVANVLDRDIIVSEFELQSYSNVDFRANTQGKDKKSLIIPLRLHV